MSSRLAAWRGAAARAIPRESVARRLTVMLATFMEVLDTTVVNVVAAAHRGQPVGQRGRVHLGADVVPGVERHHSADGRLVFHVDGAQALLYDLRGPVHGKFAAVRDGADAGRPDLLPRPAGTGRRRPATDVAGHPGGKLSAGEARHGHGGVRHGSGGGAGDRPDAGRLAPRRLAGVAFHRGVRRPDAGVPGERGRLGAAPARAGDRLPRP